MRGGNLLSFRLMIRIFDNHSVLLQKLLLKGALFMPLKFDKKELEQMEMYDGLIKHSEKLPYTPAILTKYERTLMNGWLEADIPDNVKTYADIPAELLKLSEKYGGEGRKSVIFDDWGDMHEYAVKSFLDTISMMIRHDRHFYGLVKTVKDEEKSILNALSKFKYYNDHKEEIKKEFEKSTQDSNSKTSIMIKTILLFLLQLSTKLYLRKQQKNSKTEKNFLFPKKHVMNQILCE